MIPEIGQFALIIALGIALAQSALSLTGAARRIPAFIAVARPAAQGLFVFVAIAFGCLAWSFYNNDFSVAKGAPTPPPRPPPPDRPPGGGGTHEGSLLLWVLMLSFWML